MAEISTTEPEITPVNEPLLPPPLVNAPALAAGVDRTPTLVRILLALFASRRGASLMVRENVALQLEDWRENWGYSFPVVVMDVLWNLAFVAVAFATMFWFAREETNVKLRVWICVHSMQCVLHVVFLLLEYRRMRRRISTAGPVYSLASSSSSSEAENELDRLPTFRRWDKLNTALAYLWWAMGLIMLSYTYDNYGPQRLFWLTLAFLASDVFFLTLHTIFYCALSAAYCFCLPCILAFMYYIGLQERASEAEISMLPKYTFEGSNGDVEQPDVRACRMVPVGTNSPNFSTEHVLPTEDADCCICLSDYENGELLNFLRCNHHFHSKCIAKWLRVKATCPVCKSLIG
ncbi:hypothetical protein SSX86_027886 [Deinandra increscens subsp. villosa]|uniref:RING-type E3 ubiquitin transferase n=1 Tax=Deinandra increscens subsp. villosa TaxID=3103831 RepID=A0AAP0C6M9_9ASTR